MTSGAIVLNQNALEVGLKYAERLAKSQLIPRPLQNKPDDVLVVLLTGHSYGLDPMVALRNISVINGKPVMEAGLLQGLCLARKDVCEYFTCIEATEKVATYEAKRTGSPQPVRRSWTWEQAQKAGLTGKDNWKNYPTAMLEARAKAALARAVFPDVVTGAYIHDEAEEFDRVAPTVEETFRNARPPALPTSVPALPAESASTKAAPRIQAPRQTEEAVIEATPAESPGRVLPDREPGSDDGEAAPDPMSLEHSMLIAEIANAKTPAEVAALKPRIKAFSGTEYDTLVDLGTKRVAALKAQQANGG